MFRDFTGRVDLDHVNNSRDAFKGTKGTTEARAELCLYVKCLGGDASRGLSIALGF